MSNETEQTAQEIPTPTGKPREVIPSATSAGFEDVQRRARELRGLPFDPHDYVVEKELPGALEEIEDMEVLHRLQRRDTRTSAAAHYERRIKALTAEEE